MSRWGPIVRITATCGACRYEVAGACTSPTRPQPLPDDLATPRTCPLLRQALTRATAEVTR